MYIIFAIIYFGRLPLKYVQKKKVIFIDFIPSELVFCSVWVGWSVVRSVIISEGGLSSMHLAEKQHMITEPI